MKKFNIRNLTEELLDLGASKFDIEAITNNASQYNDLVTEYKNGEKHNAYLMYQLNVAVMNQKSKLQKLNKSTGDSKEDYPMNNILKYKQSN